MKNIRLSLQWKFFLCIFLIIFPILGIIFTWVGIQSEKQAMEQVLNQARILSRQLILTRQWISDCGGILVPTESKGAKGINYFIDKKLEISAGQFRQFTPAMVTRKLSEYSNNQDLYAFRIASLTPLNPENMAKNYEKEALEKFNAKGSGEMIRFGGEDGHQRLQYIVPLYLEKGCLQCHTQKTSPSNNIQGGLCISLPIDEMSVSVKRNYLKLAILGAGLIFLTVFTLFILMHRLVIIPLKDFERMTNQIGNGDLDARVVINTGDEFEKLGHAFNDMAKRLSRGREFLEEKIEQATLELSQANQELKSLDKLKSDFIADMSHELRSPLTVVRGGIDYLSRTLKLEDNRNYLEIIDKNLKRLIRLVSELFEFAQIEAKAIEWSFERENLTVLIEEIIEIMSPLTMDKKISIHYENPGNLFVEIDLERIEQVLVNLIDNAVKFSDLRSTIHIDIEQNQQFVTVAIKDQGPGIPEEYLKTIFDKFSSVPLGDTGKKKGTGLGLAICKGIVEAHGGRIWAESEHGVSSTFFFSLPHKRESL